jgi:hypothetical protein
MVMPRRKIVGGPEELEYRLHHVLANESKPAATRASGTQMMCYVACIAALAHLYKTDLGPKFEKFANSLPIGSRKGPEVPSIVAPGGTVTDSKEPLTIPSLPGMFDDLEDKDE